jgi:hypothetical protein
MSVPLDRLYHYLADVVNHDLIIYRWAPHGSRNLEDLKELRKYQVFDWHTWLVMICHDQEPLNFDYYNHNQLAKPASDWLVNYTEFSSVAVHAIANYHAKQHLRGSMIHTLVNFYDKTLLLHSESNSTEVEKYTAANFIPVYYWSHALIAKDWFRYAEHDSELVFNPNLINHDFLIYNRAWSGTREYRLKFIEYLIDVGLLPYCQTSFNAVDNLVNYKNHVFSNADFAIQNYKLEDYLPENTHSSVASADYNNQDYKHCGIEVVLETLFDDCRWHLTEKILRPIACGKPFILMGTAGSLQYLRRYGFKTFGNVIDESYDQISNSHDRMQAVIAEMQRIAKLNKCEKIALWKTLHDIAQHNKEIFFNHLQKQVIDEYVDNLDQGVSEMKKHCTGKHYRAVLQLFSPDSKEFTYLYERLQLDYYTSQFDQWLELHGSK